MGFELFCATLIAIILGLVVCFGGYRLFLILLPIWGFFFGFFLGAETVQVIFGIGFLGFETVTDGERLSRNTIAVVKIMGLFSVLMAPVAFLFSKPGTTGKNS